MNRLQYETSPYLLQHATNPVDWYAWGAEAFAKAQSEDKPILLSIGYSACHWCHVMEHESFADPNTAALINENFIPIKVDREERPDVDDVYMQATLMFTGGHGGWPMTVFLTPDGRPFHAGTYFPPTPRHGLPSFSQILLAASDAYQNRREQLEGAANQVRDSLQNIGVGLAGTPDGLNAEVLTRAAQKLIANADKTYGGLHKGQPKFPSPMNLEFLLKVIATQPNSEILDVVTFTLRKMAQGGIYDHLGGGFHRYSVDHQWLVPHFEKMLYDNAQLARVYLHAYQLTGDEFFAQITHEILGYIQREMTDPSGGFYSTQDADSEGEEGKFFVWSETDIETLLEPHFTPEQITFVLEYYGVTPNGNFEGHNILNVADPLSDVASWHKLTLEEGQTLLKRARQILFEAREQRIKPGRDEKMLAAWNGMMLAAFAEAARVFDHEGYRQTALDNALFIMSELSMDAVELYRTHKRKPNGSGGETKIMGYLEDYANVIDGYLELYQTTFNPNDFTIAQQLAAYVIAHFFADGGFYDTSDRHEALIARPRNLQDNATPSGSTLMALNLLKLAAYTGNGDYEDKAIEVLRGLTAAMSEYPSAFGMALQALQLYVERPLEVAIIGTADESKALLDTLQKPFRPLVVTALTPTDQSAEATPPLLANRSRQKDAPTVYVCRQFVCKMPVNTVEALTPLLA